MPLSKTDSQELWIAIGDFSFAIVLSLGEAAFGTIAVGGFSVGVLSLAGRATPTGRDLSTPTH